MGNCLYTHSLICLDALNLKQQVKELEDNGCDMLHIDILDGYFSPSMPLGLDLVNRVRDITDLPFDVHLMVKEQKFFVDELLKIGVQRISFHIEDEPHVDWLLSYIKSHGVKAGVALKPATSLSTIDYVIEKCDQVVLMLMNPGYAASKTEKQVSYATRKIEGLSKIILENNLNTEIEIDGRVSIENVKKYANKNVDLFVCGTTMTNRDDLAGSYAKLNALRKSNLN